MKILRNCREMTRLVYEGELRQLSGLERLSMRFHWLVCQNCVRFKRQADTMRLALNRWRGYREE